MNFKLLLLFCMIYSAGIAQQRDTTYTFMMQPIDTTQAAEVRSYIVSIPSGYNPQNQTSLIISLHGFYDPISTYRTTLTMDSIAEANNVIMVYPQGDTCTWVYKPLFFLPNSGNGWNAGIIRGDFDDVEFISRVLDSVKLQYNINPNHVFCMGVSNGGFMTTKLAAALGINKISVAATIIGFDSLAPIGPLPFLAILGEKDTIARYNGISGIYPSWPATRANWISSNGCSVNYVADTLADLDPNDNCWVEKRTYLSCAVIFQYTEYLIKNGGHNVPNTGVCTAPAIVCNALGPINNDIDPSVEIWNFFTNNSLVKLNEQPQSATSFKSYPNPSDGIINFNFPKAEKMGSIEVYDLNGKRRFSTTLSRGSDRLVWNAASLGSGIFLYKIRVGQEVHSGKIQIINPH